MLSTAGTKFLSSQPLRRLVSTVTHAQVTKIAVAVTFHHSSAAGSRLLPPPAQRYVSSAAHVARIREKEEVQPFVVARHCEKPHPDKTDGGEDAFFTHAGPTFFVAGIADGVGGWKEQGVNSGLYSSELMSKAKEQAEDELLRKEPVRLLGKAHSAMSPSTLGSCTACIVVCDGVRNELRFANLGDSGLIGYRPHSKLMFVRSKEQQHTFNCPYQLGCESSDRAEHAGIETTQLQQHDIVVIGTDGFFDNLYDAQILEMIGSFVARKFRQSQWPQTAATRAEAQNAAAADIAASLSTSGTATTDLSASSSSSSSAATVPADYRLSADALQTLANELVEAAQRVARRTDIIRTPFNDNALKWKKRFRGGKMDDITVVVSQVQNLTARTQSAEASAS